MRVCSDVLVVAESRQIQEKSSGGAENAVKERSIGESSDGVNQRERSHGSTQNEK